MKNAMLFFFIERAGVSQPFLAGDPNQPIAVDIPVFPNPKHMEGETPELNEAGGVPDCKPLTVFGLQFAERNLRA
ncbi:MAG: hypothetical protein CFE29_05205 [Bradyrhizobiaceae bacterium PARB1]|jgi:hypothetical protein|nr:MAG: hypothetical protein CFE29_05205 [Bradyrhizobiaceae bacterium PARB1]